MDRKLTAPSPEALGGSSATSSMVGLSHISLNRNKPLPEKWTLPHEWNIEKREEYAVSQIVCFTFHLGK